MNYEWDEVKERLNIAKHNVDFTELNQYLQMNMA